MDPNLDDLARTQARLAALASDEAAVTLPPPPERRVLALDVQYAGETAHVGGSLWVGGEEEGTWAGEASTGAAYVPGFFCFREGPPLLALLGRLREEGVEPPHLLVVDGHGRAHPRQFGVACWLGLAARVPSVGCAKQGLLSGWTTPSLGRGNHTPVLLESEPVGLVVRTRSGVKPMHVSPGYALGLEDARRAVLDLPGDYRIPDPQRRADEAARRRAASARARGARELGPLAPARPSWEE
jgi:deoxyribonuclease V